jgi:hypothetical protein
MPKYIEIDGTRIRDWDSFHDVFAKALGFPDFYGRNMNAWIDCMTYVDDPEAGMTRVHVAVGEMLVLCIAGIANLRENHREIYDGLIECTAFVNWRRIEMGNDAVLALSFHG